MNIDDSSVRKKSNREIVNSMIEIDKLDIINSLSILISIIDKDLNGLFFNQAWLDLTGSTLEQESGKGWLRNIHADDLDMVFKSLSQHKSKEVFIEFRIINGVGSCRWLKCSFVARYENDHFIGYIATSTDITSQKEIEQISNDSLRLARLGARFWNLADDTEYWSAELYRIFGFPPDSFSPTHKDYLSLLHSDDRERVVRILSSAISTQKPFSLEYRVVRPDKTIRHIVCNGEIKVDVQGQPIALCSTLHDVTEYNVVKSQFVSMVSHELRTPLTSIRGALGLIMSGKFGVLTDKSRELINISVKNCDRLTRLVNEILDVERLESGKVVLNYDYVDIDKLIQDIVESNNGMAAQYHVHLNYDSRVNQMIHLDADKITQVITNLISNAVKFSEVGGTVRITARLYEYPKKMINITVEDNGPGVPISFKDKMFSKFSQADSTDKREKPGTGLGLYISQKIISAHGGKIGYKDADPKGSIFYFELPIENYNVITYGEKQSDKKMEQKRILHVENDDDITNLVAFLISDEQYDFNVARTIAEAREKLKSSFYHLVIIDVDMPDDSGLSLIPYIREHCNDTIIIIFSVYEISEKLQKSVDAYFLKSKTTNNSLLYSIRNFLS